MGNLNFDATQHSPNQSFEPIPAGWYNVKITSSEMKPTKAGNGAYLELEMTVLDGDYANRKVFDRLNLDNPNPTAVEIAQGTLSAICHAVGVYQVEDSQQLHGIPMQAKVTVRPATEQYSANNEVRGYQAIQGQGQATAPSQPQGNSQPPWAQQQTQAPQQRNAGPSAGANPDTPPWAQSSS